MAVLIATEWENQDEVLKQHSLPLVRLHSGCLCSCVKAVWETDCKADTRVDELGVESA